MAFPLEIRTERLVLRQWRDDDVPALARIATDPGYLEHMPPLDLAQARDQVDVFRRRWAEEGFSQWAAEDGETGAFIGRIGLLCHHDWPLEEHPVEVGWVLAPQARGRGRLARVPHGLVRHRSRRLGRLTAAIR